MSMAFDLSSICKTKRMRAPKIVVAGPGKIGKTTFAASAPRAVGILTEDGADAVDANAFPLASSLQDVYQAMKTLLREQHDFQTVFLDSLDWLEPLVQQHVCEVNKWASIEAPGYGKGYVAAAEEWRNLLTGFEALRQQRNMAVILIAHDKIKRFESPLHDGYDQYVLKLNDRASALVMEWADVIGWANYQITTVESDAGYGSKEVKARTTGKRILHVEPHPAHMGGNRFGLKNMPLAWGSFAEALASKGN
ncbi:MAG: ATP-binding protein [Betaproteobacteria bacterium]|nr:ATP-binding protein [Betaproteobacteria bacterium]NCA24949.1 ATP-binding protein [Betaproteobacteria bacterium]